jgi:hypothetical protein
MAPPQPASIGARCYSGAAGLHDAAPRRFVEPAYRQAERDAEAVQQRGCDHETHAIEHPGTIDRHFGAVRVAMEDRKDSDERHGGENRGRHPGENHKPEYNDRQRDGGLNEGQRNAGGAGNSAERHHNDEGRRDRP